jgi:hypothetical protein
MVSPLRESFKETNTTFLFFSLPPLPSFWCSSVWTEGLVRPCRDTKCLSTDKNTGHSIPVVTPKVSRDQDSGHLLRDQETESQETEDLLILAQETEDLLIGLLWINKARDKDKTYFWMSLWWKIKN